jgi:hypothetical protein
MTDLDPLLREAMARVKHPIDARPSISDVHRRARRHNRRRMAATVGAVACTGVATAALLIRRDSGGPSVAGQAEPVDSLSPESTQLIFGTTTTIDASPERTVDAYFVWNALSNARNDPSGVALLPTPPDQEAAQSMPTPELFGCTLDACRALFVYVVWHQIAAALGFADVFAMQAANPTIDFSKPPREGDVLMSVYSLPEGSTASTLVTECCPSPTSTISVIGDVEGDTTSVVVDPTVPTTSTATTTTG